jgi:hypothetical protein
VVTGTRGSLIVLAVGLALATALSVVVHPQNQPQTAAPAAPGGAGPQQPAGAQQPGQAFPAPRPRPRVIATTDGEIDDRDSMIRFLMYANEWDIEGIIYSSSRFHWLGSTWSGVEWIHSQIDWYSRVYSNLRLHADGYPTPEELRSKVYVGNINNVGEMEVDTPGADQIVRVLLDDRPGPVYLQVWGGTNTVAKALSTIQKQHPGQIDKVNQKAVIFIILDQDETFRKYIEPNWPKIQVLGSFRQFAVMAYGWRNLMPPEQRVFFERPWMEGNITSHHGPLAGAYETSNGAFRSEGDSPSFMHQIDVGLRSLESPSYGGWGGRFVQERPGATNVWKEAEDDGSIFKPIWRWAAAFQHDWAARADWSVKPYREANHPPVVALSGPVDVDVTPGSVLKLDLGASTDPDGDQLRYSWWQYREPGTFKGEVTIRDAGVGVSQVQIPQDATPGPTIHLIGQVTDSGKPPLTRYTRVIATVRAAARTSTAR